MSEAVITINGQTLNEAQAMTVRCAIESFASSLMEDGLGADDIGVGLSKEYSSRSEEIRKMLFWVAP